MTEETKIPQAGEYWISDDGSIIRIVGTKLNGKVIYENKTEFHYQCNSMTNWRHEPRCTSFDWVEPKLLTPGEGYEWVQLDDMIASGDEYRVKGWHSTSAVGIKCKSINTYRRKIKPVESPNDWVEITDRDHKLRARIDQYNTSIWCRDWSYVYDSHGKTVTQAGFKSARCRRKDLPVPMQSVAEVCEARVKPDTSQPKNIHGTANDADETPEPGEGYELLPVGTVLECGDEFLIGEVWVMTGNYGKEYSVLRNTYRRKIKPVEPPVETWPKYAVGTGDKLYRADSWSHVVWMQSGGNEFVQADPLYYKSRWPDFKQIIEAEALARVTPVAVDPATKALHALAIHAGFDPLGLDPCDIAEKLIQKHQAPPKRIPVRLWQSRGSGYVIALNCKPGIAFVEILHDADGFYVTEGE